jgi:hypothetical protein
MKFLGFTELRPSRDWNLEAVSHPDVARLFGGFVSIAVSTHVGDSLLPFVREKIAAFNNVPKFDVN